MSENNSALQALITEAQAAYERMSVKNPHRHLLHRLAVALVTYAHLVAHLLKQRDELQAELERLQAEKPRIVLP